MRNLQNKVVITICVFICAAMFSCKQSQQQSSDTASSNQTPDGKQLFTVNCTACHTVKKDLVGPALAGVENRWQDKTLLHQFIHNSQQVIAKDAYAKSLFEKYNHTVMTPFPNLSDADIDAILDYIKTEAAKP